MQAVNWLMFATIMILMMAYGPYGNTTAASLATLAIIGLLAIAFVPRRPVSLSSSLREERETENKNRASRKLVDTTETSMNKNDICKVGEEAHGACSELTQSGIAFAAKRFDANIADAMYIGSMAALGALTPTAMLVAKKPKITPEEARVNGKDLAFSLVTEETLLFAALVTARIQTDLRNDGLTTTEFGPHILWQALSIWEQVYPDKKAEDLLEVGMVKAAREFGATTVVPFSEFMKKRATNPPSQTMN